MNTQEFVEAVQKVVVGPTAPGILAILRDPPGKKPANDLVELSRWFNGLSDESKTMVERLLGLAVRHSVFAVFEVLDGALKVDPSWEPGDHFELRHVHGGQVEIISGPHARPLHELL